jgi:hypothetical protein
MVPTFQDQEGRDALMELARVWLRLAETYQDDSDIIKTAWLDHPRTMRDFPPRISGFWMVRPSRACCYATSKP